MTNRTEAKKLSLTLVDGVEGQSIYLNDYRIAGNKPWGGGQVRREWQVDVKDIVEACKEAGMVDPTKLTLIGDEEFLEWCGSHTVKGCQTSRTMISDGEEIREVPRCEDCRAEAQLAHTKREMGVG